GCASFLGRVCKELRAATPPYMPEDVRRWAELIQAEPWWQGGLPSLGLLRKDIGRVRMPQRPAKRKDGARGQRNCQLSNPHRYQGDQNPWSGGGSAPSEEGPGQAQQDAGGAGGPRG